jgi:hypothetical protein
MTVLRVLLAAVPAADRADAWALFDASGACVRTGRDRPTAWPKARTLEIVLAASQVRLARIALPPLPASRVAGAARYALEDQLAGPSDAHHIAVSARGKDGGVRVRWCAIRAGGHGGRDARVARIIAEPDLAVPATGWVWRATSTPGLAAARMAAPSRSTLRRPTARCPRSSPWRWVRPAAAARPRRACGSTPRLPPRRSRAGNARPASIFNRARPGVGRRHRPPHSPPRSISASSGTFDRVDARSAGRHLCPGALPCGAALLVHVVATWASGRRCDSDVARRAIEWTSHPRPASPGGERNPRRAARAALARRYSALRHAQGLPAPDDALPLLARASSALAALPPGSVKSAIYADGSWTLDLARPDATAIANLDARMRESRVPVLVATSAAGTRVRFGGP